MKRHLPWILLTLLFLTSASTALFFLYISSKNAPEWLPLEEEVEEVITEEVSS
jgi:hypothetical protein